MPYTIMDNKLNGSVSIHANSNTGNIIVQGNNIVSNVAIGNENVQSLVINQLWAGSPSGNAAYWEIKRGANVVLVIDSTCYLDFTGNGRQIKVDATANVTANLIGATAGFLVVEFQKLGPDGRGPLGANSTYNIPGA
jgi:hypothetical protein